MPNTRQAASAAGLFVLTAIAGLNGLLNGDLDINDTFLPGGSTWSSRALLPDPNFKSMYACGQTLSSSATGLIQVDNSGQGECVITFAERVDPALLVSEDANRGTVWSVGFQENNNRQPIYAGHQHWMSTGRRMTIVFTQQSLLFKIFPAKVLNEPCVIDVTANDPVDYIPLSTATSCTINFIAPRGHRVNLVQMKESSTNGHHIGNVERQFQGSVQLADEFGGDVSVMRREAQGKIMWLSSTWRAKAVLQPNTVLRVFSLPSNAFPRLVYDTAYQACTGNMCITQTRVAYCVAVVNYVQVPGTPFVADAAIHVATGRDPSSTVASIFFFSDVSQLNQLKPTFDESRFYVTDVLHLDKFALMRSLITAESPGRCGYRLLLPGSASDTPKVQLVTF